MRIEEFGVTSQGISTKLYILTNTSGMEMAVTDYGATLVNLLVPDSSGNVCDVVLGYDDVTGYENGGLFLGATVGRNANRIGKATFSINGKKYFLANNENESNLHSGPNYYNKRKWETKTVSEDRIVFALHSPDGDQGYPGNFDIMVTYVLTEDNEVQIIYDGVSDEDTIVNLTNHSYFNLNGHASGSILEHQVKLNADYFTRADAHSIPTGELIEVSGTPMDFRTLKPVGQDIEAPYEAVELGKGYDHNWVLNQEDEKAAELLSMDRKIRMDVITDLPGMQMYSGNFIDGEMGKEGACYQKRQAICFETQFFPDAVNHENFASPILKAGQHFNSRTIYKFVQIRG